MIFDTLSQRSKFWSREPDCPVKLIELGGLAIQVIVAPFTAILYHAWEAPKSDKDF